MLLSQLAGVGNFCFNLCSPILSIICILSSQAFSLQILLYALFAQFPWSTLLPFPSYFKLHNLMYLGFDISMDGMTIPQRSALNYHIFDLHNNTLSTVLTPYIILIILRSTNDQRSHTILRHPQQ